MILVLVFGVVLSAATLVSERARQTILSTSVMFLVAGFLVGRGAFDWVRLEPRQHVVETFAELALFSILFVDGAQLRLHDLRRAWRLPGRALLFGLPLTLFGIAAAAHYILHRDWIESLLIGAILSPTDPVFSAAILEHESVPWRLRRLLTVESGLNDGLALPIVLVLIRMAGHEPLHPLIYVADTAGGIVLGIAVAYAFLWLERQQLFAASARYRPLGGLGIAATVWGLSNVLGTNQFLAAFAAGMTLVTVQPDFARDFLKLGGPAAEAFKLAALLAFGSILDFDRLLAPGWSGLLVAGLTLLAARPAALLFALFRSGLSRTEWLAAAWFGPKGFASVLYALIMLHAGIPYGIALFEEIALVTTISIVVHSSTDVFVARWFMTEEREAG